MSTVRITVVFHPWHADREERDHLIAEAAALSPQTPVDVLSFTGEAHPGAVALRLAKRLGESTGRQLILLPTGTESEAIAALVAAAGSGVSFGRCSAVALGDDAISAKRPAYGGRVELSLSSNARITCATLRPQGASVPAASVNASDIAMQEPAPYPVEALPAGDGKPRVEGATVVVSGGRGMGGPDGFEWLARIADALGAGLGGSLPTVDAGWVPVAHQVGISGKFVTPRVYFAVGISGTPQHLAGISPNTRIVALNNDRDAPIFSRSDVGVEGDWREILPLLAQELESAAPNR